MEEDIIKIEQATATKSLFKSKMVNLDKIPEVRDYINSKTNSTIFNKGNIIDNAIFDVENIMEVIDTLNNINYSFNFVYPNSAPGEFYNLIVNKSPDGFTRDIYVLKYVCDIIQTPIFLENNSNFKYFKGTIAMHKYTDFFKKDAFYKSDTKCPPNFDKYGDPIPCNINNVDGSSTSTGGGSGSTGPNDTSNTSGTSNTSDTSGTSDAGSTSSDSSSTSSSDNGGNGTSSGGGSFQPCFLEWGDVTYVVDCRRIKDIEALQKSDINCKDCPTSIDGGVGVNTTSTANSINAILGGTLNSAQLNWLSDPNNSDKVADIKAFLKTNNSKEANKFVKLAFDALMSGVEVDFNEAYINTSTPDDNYFYQGQKQLISNPLVLSNGVKVSVSFVSFTSDNKSSNQKVSIDLIDGLKFAIEQANNNLSATNRITSINIYATTNGKHNSSSNHYNGTALDINRINGVRMAVSGVTDQIVELQKSMDNFTYIRENFGPSFRHKFSKEKPIGNQWNLNHPVGLHSDHIHVSVRR